MVCFLSAHVLFYYIAHFRFNCLIFCFRVNELILHYLPSISAPCSIIDGEVKSVDAELSKSILENNKCYMLDCGSEVFVWVGRVTQVDERKAAIQAAEVQL